nr:MAG TPA: hypothetical protein [Caudoviricetes sp.]
MNVIAILSTNLSTPRQSDEAYPPTAGTSKQTGCDRPAPIGYPRYLLEGLSIDEGCPKFGGRRGETPKSAPTRGVIMDR